MKEYYYLNIVGRIFSTVFQQSCRIISVNNDSQYQCRKEEVL